MFNIVSCTTRGEDMMAHRHVDDKVTKTLSISIHIHPLFVEPPQTFMYVGNTRHAWEIDETHQPRLDFHCGMYKFHRCGGSEHLVYVAGYL